MKRFYCDGKKGFCTHPDACQDACSECRHFNGKGGEDVEVPEGATRWWTFLFRFKKRLKALWSTIHRR